MPKVWNKRHKNVPKDAVYVGRPTKWGNPYSHQGVSLAKFRVRTREDAVSYYRASLSDSLRTAAKQELRGKDLVCWCAPLPCHADILLEIANSDD